MGATLGNLVKGSSPTDRIAQGSLSGGLGGLGKSLQQPQPMSGGQSFQAPAATPVDPGYFKPQQFPQNNQAFYG